MLCIGAWTRQVTAAKEHEGVFLEANLGGPQGLRILCPGPENSEGVRDTEMPGGEVQVGIPSA